MDMLFHATSAAFLGRILGERRPGWLCLAAVIGVIPDLVSNVVCITSYQLAHSLALQLPIVLILLLLNWRIAFGGLLHVVLDIPTHQYATTHLFYPFAKWDLPIGIAWYEGLGFLTWGLLWITLAALILLYGMDQKARKLCKIKAPEERACPSPYSPRAD
ncbi:MAG: hypothetical protein NT011_09290 [Kiritimatiellaeota bacterium]|nr:hypothetical protein [Kiritimatiellota bacterium]